MAAGRGDQKGAFGVVLTLDVDEVLVHVRMLGEELLEVDRFGVHLELPGRKPTASDSDPTGYTLTPSTTAASAALARGTTSPSRPSRTAWSAIGGIPLTGVSPGLTHHFSRAYASQWGIWARW